jgi:two-component system response regulator AtoC
MQDRQKRILVIDDDEEITAVVKLGLERKGYAVTTYNDPAEAVEAFEPASYDLVLCDIRMPGMDGLSVCRRLAALDKGVKICLLSGFDIRGAEAEKGPPAKFHAFISKPASLSTLALAVEGLLATELCKE